MKLSKKIIFLFLVCVTNFSIAQLQKNNIPENKYRAMNWTTENGLSQDEVYEMIKDINGFLWIGTRYGLNRFDGSTVKNYFADKTKQNKTIISNEIHGLIEDSLHNIWIGTDKGLSCYDIKADTFRHFLSPYHDHLIIPFQATKDEVFCILYTEGFQEFFITTYNIHSFAKKTLVKLTSTDTVGFALSDQYPIFDASSNCVWMEKGIPGGTGGGLLQISLTNGKRKEFTWLCYKNIPNHSHFTEGMRYDRTRNCIWINSNDGLTQFTLSNKKFHHIDALNKWVNVKDYGQWAGIDIDPQGRVWLGTYPAGIIIYDPATNTANIPFPKDSILQENISGANVSIYCDQDGIIWSGFWARKGIYQLVPYSQAVTRYIADAANSHSLSDNHVYNCMNADHGNVWVGTADGLNIFDPNTGIFHVLREKDLPGLKGKLILPISIDTVLHKAWLSIHDRSLLFEMDIRTKRCNPVIFEDSNNLRMSSLNFIVPERYQSECIIPAYSDNQFDIFMLNRDSALAKQVLSFPAKDIIGWRTPNDDHVLFLKRSETVGNLTYTDSNGKWIRVSNPLDNIQWNSITYNKDDDTYWVVAEQQLIHFTRNFREIRRYTHEDGIPEIEIHNIIADNRNNIWFNSDLSIFRLNIKTGKITTLSEKDGFIKQNFTGTPTPGIKDIYGNLYFPCGQTYGAGFDKVGPDKLQENYPPSKVYFTSVEINQNPFTLNTGVNNLKDLKLKYFQNKITIETGIVDYYSKGKSRIRYKLEGMNKDWQYAPAYYTIRYDGLQPANYKLLIQASNAADQFNGPVKSLLIQITPAFWNTWWLRTLATIFILVLS